jgi:hypothetical protein
MAFTADSPELAKAVKLANILSAHRQMVGVANGFGYTAAVYSELFTMVKK